jgi:hypothetical protein
MENNMSSKLHTDDAALALAASVVERAHDLISDGWTQGKMSTGEGGAEAWCIHGAVAQALQEVFGENRHYQGDSQYVSDIACMFIVDEAMTSGIKEKPGAWAAGWNDAPERTHLEVLKALDGAARRLWNLSIEQEPAFTWEPSKWADVDIASEVNHNFLHAELAHA